MNTETKFNARFIAALLALAALSLVFAATAFGADGVAKVNVNTATAEELQTLPRVGPKLAEKIIAARPIKDLAALDQVKGVGPKMLEALKPLVVFQ